MDQEPNEYELALRARAGDREALAKLVERTRLGLFKLAYAELRHYDDAQDAVAAALLQVCLHVGELRQPERIRAWMQSIVRNEAHRLRRGRGASPLRLDEAEGRTEGAVPSLLLLDIDRALQRLPVNQAEAVRLFYLHHLSLEEIARRLGRSRGTIGSWLHRGRRHLAKEISPWIGGIPMSSSSPVGAPSRAHPRIKVIGAGGGGGHAVNRMIEAGLTGVEFIGVDTDSPALDLSSAPERLQIGAALTKGLGAGDDPERGRRAAEESRQEIKKRLVGAEMVFIIAGMGGGTGTGAAPVIAEIARELNALTVAGVTRPFTFESARRLQIAEEGIARLEPRVDTIITIQNDRLLPSAEPQKTPPEAFQATDEALRHAVQCVSDILTVPASGGVQFAEVKTILARAGRAIFGIGQAHGDNRARSAAERAVSNPLSQESHGRARSILLTITAGPDLALEEVYLAADVISAAIPLAAEDSSLILGAVFDETMLQDVRVAVMAANLVS
jgi:cell division protein FtsZ